MNYQWLAISVRIRISHRVGVSKLCSKIYLLCYASLRKESTYYAQNVGLLCSRLCWCAHENIIIAEISEI